jgi:hypothetical protein
MGNGEGSDKGKLGEVLPALRENLSAEMICGYAASSVIA